MRIAHIIPLKNKALAVLLLMLFCTLLATAVLFINNRTKTDWTQNPYVLYEKNLTARIGAYAPYAFLNKGGILDGYVIDLTNAISRVMSVRVILVSRKLDDPLEITNPPDADVVLCMVKTPATSLVYDFTPPYATHNFSIFAREGTEILPDLKNLLNNPAVVINADGVYYDLNASKYNSMAVGIADSAEEAMHMVARGDYEYTILETYIGNKIINEQSLTNVSLLMDTGETVEYAFAVQKDNSEALSIFTEGLAYLKSTGQYDKIQNRWLDQRYLLTKTDRDSYILYVALFLGISLAMILAFYLWSHTLKKQVVQRTSELEAEIQERRRAEKRLLISQAQLIQADKLAAIGTLASGIAHEINNPNGLISINTSTLKSFIHDIVPLLESKYAEEGDFDLGGMPWSQFREELDNILDDTQNASHKIKNIVEDLKDFARVDSLNYTELVDLNHVTQAVLRLLGSMIRKCTDHLELDLAEDLPVTYGSVQKIEQVILNLVINSCQALESRSKGLFIRTRFRPECNSLEFTIIDEGKGILPEHMAYLFDPFFTSKRDEGGTGLGLAISNSIVEAHQGSLRLESVYGSGTTATVTLPVRTEEAARKAQAAHTSDTPGGTGLNGWIPQGVKL